MLSYGARWWVTMARANNEILCRSFSAWRTRIIDAASISRVDFHFWIAAQFEGLTKIGSKRDGAARAIGFQRRKLTATRGLVTVRENRPGADLALAAQPFDTPNLGALTGLAVRGRAALPPSR